MGNLTQMNGDHLHSTATWHLEHSEMQERSVATTNNCTQEQVPGFWMFLTLKQSVFCTAADSQAA